MKRVTQEDAEMVNDFTNYVNSLSTGGVSKENIDEINKIKEIADAMFKRTFQPHNPNSNWKRVIKTKKNGERTFRVVYVEKK